MTTQAVSICGSILDQTVTLGQFGVDIHSTELQEEFYLARQNWSLLQANEAEGGEEEEKREEEDED